MRGDVTSWWSGTAEEEKVGEALETTSHRIAEPGGGGGGDGCAGGGGGGGGGEEVEGSG